MRGVKTDRDDFGIRLAIIVSHPIQYYVPLYRRLATSTDLCIRVFFTWHAAETAKHDPGFGKEVAWDIPLTEGYEHELVENTAANPGSRHFWGIRNPKLIGRVIQWQPDAVHITGYAYASHLNAIRGFQRRGIPILFRGDSHLLDQRRDRRWLLKKTLLRQVYGWTSACLYVGRHNLEYYRELGVAPEKLFYCPHSIEVERFAEPNQDFEREASQWREQLGILEDKIVLLFAGKFEARKQPIELVEAVLRFRDDRLVLLMVGNGPLETEVAAVARSNPNQIKVLPFQNQSRMPVVYRLGDVFVLPSAFGETWGLALNEALACGRRVIASDKVGAAPDLISTSKEGTVFKNGDWTDFKEKLHFLIATPGDSHHLRVAAHKFDISETERTLVDCLSTIVDGHKAFARGTLYGDNGR
jgi:glycosyltransferase involved in cell wall biosynthesis